MNERNLDIAVEPVECLAVCKRPATVAFAGGGKWTYVIGDLDRGVHVDELINSAQSFAATDNGIVAWKDRPACFKKGVVSRTPPLLERYFAARARSIASLISARASAASPQPAILAHLPGSRSL